MMATRPLLPPLIRAAPSPTFLISQPAMRIRQISIAHRGRMRGPLHLHQLGKAALPHHRPAGRLQRSLFDPKVGLAVFTLGVVGGPILYSAMYSRFGAGAGALGQDDAGSSARAEISAGFHDLSSLSSASGPLRIPVRDILIAPDSSFSSRERDTSSSE
ncbi:hypothetical protein BCR35DRAFT_353664 [Leucosporidium creatinivorum]|uniref:Uncharacterized protein n=1 Tax=Leucosporidium creatinivorum TaxID=106004 RepID=A0A1Y2EUV9_9BASI|nr:hypothetical protein BCR35DRAFT_353664 [Leucosporidium creatinivorum]